MRLVTPTDWAFACSRNPHPECLHCSGLLPCSYQSVGSPSLISLGMPAFLGIFRQRLKTQRVVCLVVEQAASYTWLLAVWELVQCTVHLISGPRYSASMPSSSVVQARYQYWRVTRTKPVVGRREPSTLVRPAGSSEEHSDGVANAKGAQHGELEPPVAEDRAGTRVRDQVLHFFQVRLASRLQVRGLGRLSGWILGLGILAPDWLQTIPSFWRPFKLLPGALGFTLVVGDSAAAPKSPVAHLCCQHCPLANIQLHCGCPRRGLQKWIKGRGKP